MHQALVAYLESAEQCEPWEVDALQTLTWRHDVPFTTKHVRELREALRTSERRDVTQVRRISRR